MASLLGRLLGFGRKDAVAEEASEERMSRSERHLTHESIEERRADAWVEEYGMTGIPQIDTNDEFGPPRP
jgi:hypothetical protein